jgi:hypothetical protein
LLQVLLSIGLGLPTNSMHGDMSNGAKWGFMIDLGVEGGKKGGGYLLKYEIKIGLYEINQGELRNDSLH